MSDANHRFLSCLTLRLDKPKENCGRCFIIAKQGVNDYHGTHDACYAPSPRWLGLQGRLRAMPAVVVAGARQAGKSTLAQELMPGGRRFLSLDDPDVADAAAAIPRRSWGGSQ